MARTSFSYSLLPGSLRGGAENVNQNNGCLCFLIKFKSPSKSVVKKEVAF